MKTSKKIIVKHTTVFLRLNGLINMRVYTGTLNMNMYSVSPLGQPRIPYVSVPTVLS